MWEKICCVTGHRDIPADKMEYFPGCYMRRNRYIWACSALSIKKSNFIDDSPQNICHYFTEYLPDVQ